MAVVQLEIHSLLLDVLEIAAVLRKPEGSRFSQTGFKLYQASSSVTLALVVTSCTFYALYDEGNKLMAIVIGAGAFQYFVGNLLLIYNKNDIQDMLATSAEVFYQITPNAENRSKIELQQKKSHAFTKAFTIFICMNVIVGIAEALLKTWLSGRMSFPFEMSCFGLPTVPCWFYQIVCATQLVLTISFNFIIRKTIIYLTWGYADVLSTMIRDRPVYDDEENDRRIHKLYCDYSRFAASFSILFGLTAFIEVVFATVRSCFQSYHAILAISNNEWAKAGGSLMAFVSSIAVTYLVCSCGEDLDEINKIMRDGFLESKWYGNSPQSRKRLLPMLILNQKPIRFQYRHHTYFNYEILMQVLQTTYSLTTALAHFM